MNGFVHILVYGSMNIWFRILIFLAISSAGIYFFLSSCLAKDHKPDWGYPKPGKISLGGLSHLPYFGAQIAMAVICVIEVILGSLTGVVLITTLTGGVIWIITFILDVKTGHFDQLKKVN